MRKNKLNKIIHHKGHKGKHEGHNDIEPVIIYL